MSPLVFGFQDRFWPKREATKRFNRSFIDSMKDLRSSLGEIKANHAARGLLMSGATIKKGLKAYSDSLGQATDKCLDYILAKSPNDGWKRRKLLELLDAIYLVYAERYADVLQKECIRIAGGGGAAAEEAERRRLAIIDACHDRMAQFQEGIGLPKPENWATRHPFVTAAIITIIGIVVARLFGFIGFSN